MARNWFVARTENNRENAAAESLKSLGVTYFLPTYMKTYKPSYSYRPMFLFRNYIFFSTDNPKCWPLINKADGIAYVLTSKPDGGLYQMPCAIDSEAIESLREQSLELDEEKNGRIVKRRQYITKDCYVRIISGPFAGMEGTDRALVDWSNNDRASLLLKLFGKEVRAQFFIKDLQKVSA